jgi:hypothetical protein
MIMTYHKVQFNETTVEQIYADSDAWKLAHPDVSIVSETILQNDDETYTDTIIYTNGD